MNYREKNFLFKDLQDLSGERVLEQHEHDNNSIIDINKTVNKFDLHSRNTSTFIAICITYRVTTLTQGQ